MTPLQHLPSSPAIIIVPREPSRLHFPPLGKFLSLPVSLPLSNRILRRLRPLRILLPPLQPTPHGLLLRSQLTDHPVVRLVYRPFRILLPPLQPTLHGLLLRSQLTDPPVVRLVYRPFRILLPPLQPTLHGLLLRSQLTDPPVVRLVYRPFRIPLLRTQLANTLF